MSFEKMSKAFQRAFGFSNSGLYKSAIKLYEEDLKDNPRNVASMNNIAVAKINLAISENNREYLLEAKEHLEEAIKIVSESEDYNYGFPMAEGNLLWVIKLLEV